MAEPKKIVFAGIHGCGFKIVDIDGDIYIGNLTSASEEHIYSNIHITDSAKFESILNKIKHIEYETESVCRLCNKESKKAYGFKINNTVYSWNDSLFYCINQHKLLIPGDFIIGIFKKLNPIYSGLNFSSSMLSSCYYDKYSIVSMPRDELLSDGSQWVRPQMFHTKQNECSFIYPLNPPPYLKSINVLNSNSTPYQPYKYIIINQPSATWENLQPVMFCNKCIGFLMNKYGIDGPVANYSNHQPLLWNGNSFVDSKGSKSDNLCNGHN
jgi:hypothetical protein